MYINCIFTETSLLDVIPVILSISWTFSWWCSIKVCKELYKAEITTKQTITNTSTPVIWTGVYPRMMIAITTVVKDTFWQCIKYKIQNTLYVFQMPVWNTCISNTLQHWPCCKASGGQFLRPHIVRGCPASLSHQANNRLMHYRFFTFDLGAYPWAKVHQKRWPTTHLGLQNFSPIAQTVYEICVTNFFTFWPRVANPWAKVHQREMTC